MGYRNYFLGKNKKTECLVIFGECTGINAEYVRYFIVQANGDVLDLAQGTLDTIAKLALRRRVIFLIPTEQVLITHIFLPEMSRKKTKKAIPHVLEEQLADTLDNVCFFQGKRDTTGKISIAVINRNYFLNYTEAFFSAGLDIDMAIPTVLSLPHSEHAWVIWVDELFMLLRRDKELGLHVDRENIALACETLLSQIKLHQPKKIELYGTTDSVIAIKKIIASWNVPIITHHHAIDFYHLLAQGLSDPPSINLLHNHYLQKTKRFFKQRAIAFCGQLAKYSFIIFIVAISFHTVYCEMKKTWVHQKIEHLAQSTIAIDKVLSQEKSKAMGGEFFYLLAKLGMVLHQVGSAQLQTIHFQNHVMTIEVYFFDPQRMRQVEQQWIAEGLDIEKIHSFSRGYYLDVRYRLREISKWI